MIFIAVIVIGVILLLILAFITWVARKNEIENERQRDETFNALVEKNNKALESFTQVQNKLLNLHENTSTLMKSIEGLVQVATRYLDIQIDKRQRTDEERKRSKTKKDS